ncbi:MAG: SpoIVB peptidase S55 domain-containing protein [Acidobacteriota bacterium]
MRKEKALYIVGITVFCLLFLITELFCTILSIDQIKPGMKGVGQSVFLGNQIEEFQVEIVGVLQNVQPKRNIILARLKSPLLEKTGVMSGMSGSPVYIDGKLIGAVAYSFPYAKEAIAGITPIDEMMAVEGGTEKSVSFFRRQPVSKSLSLQELLEMHEDILAPVFMRYVDGQAFTSLSHPLIFGGFSSTVFEKNKSFFSRMGFSPVLAGSGGQAVEKISPPDMKLRPGDAVGVQLVSGDLNISAVGTVTQVEGNKILAFGHPFYNLGSVDYAMTRANVITVVPSVSSSFKLAETGPLLGRFSQDRTAGVLGEIGKMPRFVPVSIKMMDPTGELKEFKIKVVEDKILTPVYLNVSLQSLLYSEERNVGNLSLAMKGNIYLENGQSIHIEDLFSGNFDTSVQDLSGLLTAVVYFLANNEFRDLSIYEINLEITTSEEVKYSYLEKVWLNKYDAYPGERIQLQVYSRNFRGESVVQEVSLTVPAMPSGSEIFLVVADAESMQQIEMGQYKTRAFVPRSLNQLIRLLGNLRKNNRIYFKILASKPGLFLKGEEMPNLPPTFKFMFSSPRATSSVPTELDRSTLSEYQYPVPYVFKGTAVIPIKIK